MALPDLTALAALALFSAGFLAGLMNALAGGGTFVSFPVFMAMGLPPVMANASSAVAVWPGHAMATVAYRRELRSMEGNLWPIAAAAVLGGAVGAYLLSAIDSAAFVKLVPPLLLGATLLFAFGPSVNRWLTAATFRSLGFVGLLGVLAFGIYGSFFGAGLGIMLMAGLLLLGVQEPNRNNALKNMLATLVTSVGAVVLGFSGLVVWSHTACAFAGAVLGGLAGAQLARRVSIVWMRAMVLTLGFVLTAHYTIKYYFG